MGFCESSDVVIVFDLDDTLYKEIDYQSSGLAEIFRWISRVYGKPLPADLEALRAVDVLDPLATACQLFGLQPSVKESLLWIYRLHEPSISLSFVDQELLKELEKSYKIAILSDGRSISQRQKLKALGLEHLPVYISEDYGANKPSPLRYEQIMRDISATRYFYVADNPRKDFLAPNVLGWVTIGLRDDGRNIHKQDLTSIEAKYLPHHWIDSLDGILKYLC